MYCPKCGKEFQARSRFCTNCGNKRKQSFLLGFMLIIFLGVCSFLFLEVSKLLEKEPAQIQTASASIEAEVKPEPKEITPVVKKELPEEEKVRELTEIIADAQQNVFTIFTSNSQGSGFLYNHDGIVVTNAHVVEGSVDVTVRTINGMEHAGKVIGYSNDTDVAIIKVHDFTGRTPLTMEYETPSLIGEEVIALGSPLGYENTATMGYITGSGRNFYIDNFVYSNLYQISAPISSGSSGGPLLAQGTEKVIAINSAKDLRDTAVGFSIPIYTVHSLIESWIAQPMTEEQIYAMFYNINGLYFYDYLWDYYEEGYFDDGHYSDDTSVYEYWEYDYSYDEYEYEYDYHEIEVDDYEYNYDYDYDYEYDYDYDYDYNYEYDYEFEYEEEVESFHHDSEYWYEDEEDDVE